MNVLFIGGTGLIGTACGQQLLEDKTINLTLLHRGNRAPAYQGVEILIADANDPDSLKRAVAGRRFDVVVEWIAFVPEQVQRDIDIFKGNVSQYIFIGTASSYQKPAGHYRITESTPLSNPYWQYSRDKAECERVIKASGMPYTIVRPSHTYGAGRIPFPIGARDGWTPLQRLLDGKPVIMPGDGTSLWTVTHNTDFARAFAGLVGQHKALYQDFHITSDEALSWSTIVKTVGFALGVEPNFVYLPSTVIENKYPQFQGQLIGDKSLSVIFDNSKIKDYVPGFKAQVSFAEGVRREIQYWEQKEKTVDEDYNRLMDDMCALAERMYAL